MSRRDEILERVRQIPALPVSAVDLLHRIEDPDVDLDDLTRAIELDPNLTSNLLRLANSSYFGTPRSIGSVRDGLVRLGLKNVHLVVASEVAPIIGPEVTGYGLPVRQLWNHSLAVAVAATELATALGRSPTSHLFSAALLHDVGKIVLGTFLEVSGEAVVALAFSTGTSFEEAERKVLGTDHAEVGATLLEAWHLPPAILEAVRWHHDPDRVETETVDLVHIANALCLMAGIGLGRGGLHYTVAQSALGRLEMAPEVGQGVVLHVLDRLAGLDGILAGRTQPSGGEPS